ncbi:MAG: hypothetical protein HND39_06225 [Ignavibacteriota bacterium]|jgi:hypothetical protein|nr:MAG: hypothetical protein EDM72_01795 [Chlorobiota bacterium]MBE7475867.1 hypothetical protein [Ignavibacteriales bacterium]MBL1123325.1 hypothetical protein [Ignavibacteriota bacterium]MBV6420338.1 hypothetical protein [Ignavibacteriaceae bacterium]MCE7856526.1 hypothetical protein [Ignavibacteria bacterium CHB3]MEB2295455.1 FxLYD domain-containing protein [Ignavibacteria bacterium]
MVRFLSIIIIIAGIGGGIYYLLSMERTEDIKVTGKLQISQQPGKYVQTSEGSGGSYFAVVEGKIRNNLGKPIKNVFIKYVIAGEETSATVFDLAPGQEMKFNTRGVNTSETHPEYNFVGIYYD